MSVISFEEKDHPIFYYDVRVFIQGVEVTSFLEESVVVTYTDRDGFNTCNLTLSNQGMAFVLTPENLGYQSKPGAPFAFDPKDTIDPIWRGALGEQNMRALPKFSELPKKMIYDFKNKENQKTVIKSDPYATRLYPLDAARPVFHKLDRIRVFLHNPLREPEFEGDEQWLPLFTGFIDTYPWEHDDITGKSTIKITAQDIRWVMQRMRVVMNFAPKNDEINQAVFYASEGVGLFADLKIRSGEATSHAFVGNSLEQMAKHLIVGSPNGVYNHSRAVGGFRLGETVIFDGRIDQNKVGAKKTINEQKSSSAVTGELAKLEQWNLLTVFGEKKTWYETADVEAIGKGTYAYGPWDPAGDGDTANPCKLHLLLPPNGSGWNEVVSRTYETTTDQFEFTSRYDIFREFVSNIDYQWLVNGMGDILIEFPTYDFDPSDFGEFSSIFIIDKHMKNHMINDEGAEVVAGVIATPGYTRYEAETFSDPQFDLRAGVAKSNLIAARSGAVVETVMVPFLGNKAATGGSIGKLRMMAQIELQKRLANANELSFEFEYRPFIYPNRPILDFQMRRVGSSSSVTNTVPIFGAGSTGVSVRFARIADAEGKFRYIFGGENMPLNYRTMFKKGTSGLENTGIDVFTR